MKALTDTKKKIIRKKNTLKNCLVNSFGYRSYYSEKIDENVAYIVSHSGKDLVGNMLRIAQELSKPEYRNLKLYIQVKKEQLDRIKKIAERYKIKATYLIKTSEQLYVMEKARYLFTDSFLMAQFVKRDGQIVVNTWHGTPLKTLGRQIKTERHSISGIQRSLIMSDYILFPNHYTKDIFIRDYMLENLWKGKSLLAGYPRNAVFYDAQRRKDVIRELNLEGKEVFGYFPTFRGVVFHPQDTQQRDFVEKYLEEIDPLLNDNQVLIVKFHLHNREKIDFSKFKHIIGFPENDGYETYDVLNVVDCLITDYSSVLFDFAVTGRKIVLFAYDEAEYFAERGTYFNLSDLPFPKVDNVRDLLKELNQPKSYDDLMFLERFCPFDNPDATRLFCKHVVKREKALSEENAPRNNKKNIFIYVSNLAKNGITTAAVGLLNNLDRSENNYIAVFSKEIVRTSDRVQAIPENINYYALTGVVHYRLFEKLSFLDLLRQEKNISSICKNLEQVFDREWEKYFHGLDVDAVIDFGGYDKEIGFLFSRCRTKNAVFVHNDMILEAEVRKNQRVQILHYLYNKFNKVAVVNESLCETTERISGNKQNIVVVHNCVDYDKIRSLANKPITFEKDTKCILNDPRGLIGILEDKNIVKFVTIGRFSPEKGHLRLIDAFETYWLKNQKSFLLIIGGHGALFPETVRYAETKLCRNNIIIIKSIWNPMPILKRCNLFILSSKYEGLPLVLMEADCLGIPCISTDIQSTRDLFRAHNGTIVENTTEGISQGMNLFDEGKVKTLGIDFKELNRQAIAQFKHLLAE